MPPRSGPDAGSDALLHERQQEIDRPGDEALDHRDLHRIGGRQLARQVVVDSPAQAGAGDEKCTPVEADIAPPVQDSDDCTGEDRGRSESDPSVDVLLEHEPSDRERGEALEVEQQCRGGSPRAGETQHQQHRSDDAAEQDHRRQPRQVRTSQRGFDCRCPEADATMAGQAPARGRRPRYRTPARATDRRRRGEAWPRACSRRTARRKRGRRALRAKDATWSFGGPIRCNSHPIIVRLDRRSRCFQPRLRGL